MNINSFVPCTKIKTWIKYVYMNIDGKFQEQFDFHLKDITVAKLIEYLYRPKDSASLAVTRILFGSLDAYLNPSLSKETVPYWNYFILKYQFFILYFMAGMKKGTAEWLTGYSVQNLSEHWVFSPFKLFLTVPQTDYLIVHWFVFAFDLTVAIWMMWSRTRHVAMMFCALFHLMNSRLFRIGMFPWVCLATMPLFYSFDWPKIIISYADKKISKVKGRICKCLMLTLNTTGRTSKNHAIKLIAKDIDNEPDELPNIDETNERIGDEKNDSETNFDNERLLAEDEKTFNSEKDDLDTKNNFTKTPKEGAGRRKLTTFAFIVFHVLSQAFLPYSHFITKGYNNWTNGLYGYSWDMMVHTWEIESVIVKVVDNENRKEFYVDPYIYTPNDRWTRHGDMIYQYARCLKYNIIKKIMDKSLNRGKVMSKNISIYVDVWCSMNGRFTQRMFDPKTDLLKTSWSPFKPIPYLMPLLDNALDWRSELRDIKEDVHTWNNYSDVTFIADFPGYYQEKFIPTEVSNVTMTILDGVVAYEPEITKFSQGQSYKLTKGNRIKLESGMFHRVLNIGTEPAFYMYTFANISEATNFETSAPSPKLPVGQELLRRLKNMVKFSNVVISNVFNMFFRRCQ